MNNKFSTPFNLLLYIYIYIYKVSYYFFKHYLTPSFTHVWAQLAIFIFLLPSIFFYLLYKQYHEVQVLSFRKHAAKYFPPTSGINLKSKFFGYLISYLI